MLGNILHYTSIYNYKQDRIRDWVTMPKANGYSFLHVTVMGPEGKWVEVQIRSERMNEIAERGLLLIGNTKEKQITTANSINGKFSPRGNAPKPANPIASGRTHLPTLTRSSLSALCDAGGISPAAWLRAMEFCGFRPNGTAWLAYWRQLCLLGGALFFVAGMVCFIAWNWGANAAAGRMALTGGAVVAGSGFASVLLGPDTRRGGFCCWCAASALGQCWRCLGRPIKPGPSCGNFLRYETFLLVAAGTGGQTNRAVVCRVACGQYVWGAVAWARSYVAPGGAGADDYCARVACCHCLRCGVLGVGSVQGNMPGREKIRAASRE